ncbi:MAG: hypothetical protein RL145_401 [Pseudomonadota bacterium]|jgi:two-component system phosphate regulon response regulator PhoB
MISILISKPSPQMLIELVRQRPEWDFIPLDLEPPTKLPSREIWAFVGWGDGIQSGLKICRTLRKLAPSARLHIYMVLRVEEIEEYGAVLKSMEIDAVRGPLSARRVIESVESCPEFDGQYPVRFEIGDLLIDARAHLVRIKGKSVSLTPTEFKILVHLLKNAGRIVSRSEFILTIGKNGRDVQERSIDVWISRLRRILSTNSTQLAIRNVKGKGYVIDV